MTNQGNTAPAPAPQNVHYTLVAACIFVIAVIALAAALSYTRGIMIPFVVAVFLSYFIVPLVIFFKKKARFPHWAAVSASLMAVVLFIFTFAMILRNSIIELIDSVFLYEEKLQRLMEVVGPILTRFNIRYDEHTIVTKIKELPLFDFVQSAAGTTVTFVLDFSLVMIFLIFLVSGHNTNEKKTGIGALIDEKIRSYILTKVFTSAITAISVWIILASFRVDLALMFALLTFFFAFIPTLGSIISTLLPLPIALLQFEAGWEVWTILALLAVVQMLIGNVLEPKLLGKGLDLHPITILLSLMFWGLIWGFAGTFLAVPITAVLKIVLERITLTRGLSEMLAGRTPFAHET